MTPVTNYKNYAFIYDPIIDCSSEAGGEGEAGAGAMTYMHDMNDIINRSYEEPFKWYFIVYKPYDRAYEKQPDWFQARGIDRVRKSLKSPAYILTRELLATKTHINVLMASCDPPLDNTDLCNKYKLHVSELPTLGDRQRVLHYITKENTSRPFVKYQDYILSR